MGKAKEAKIRKAYGVKMAKEWAEKGVKIDPSIAKHFEAPKKGTHLRQVMKSAKAPMAKKVVKKTVGKVLRKLIPGVGAAAIAHDVLKGVSKATCSKRGGKWASGKCVGVKKTKFKSGSKVKDPISKR